MRPHRVRLTHSLVENYNLSKRMLVHRPEPRSREQIENFHCDGVPAAWHDMQNAPLPLGFAQCPDSGAFRLLQQEQPSDAHMQCSAP